MAVINNSKYIMLLRGNKGKGREKGKMKKTEGYVVRRLEDEYLVLPSGRRTEEVNEVISLSETAGFIYMHAERAENDFAEKRNSPMKNG